MVSVLPGTVTAWDTVPLEHGTVAGRPERAGVDEKAQLVAWSTWAERVTLPPEAVSDVGAAAKFDTVGLGGSPAWVSLTTVALTVVVPVTARWKAYV